MAVTWHGCKKIRHNRVAEHHPRSFVCPIRHTQRIYYGQGRSRHRALEDARADLRPRRFTGTAEAPPATSQDSPHDAEDTDTTTTVSVVMNF